VVRRAPAPGHRQFQSEGGGKDPTGLAQPQKEMMVDLVSSGLQPLRLRTAKWRKSRHSNPSGDCVEMARLPGRRVAVRDSRRPDGPVLLFTQAAWETFLRNLREGY
jgi:Domain of unknown function (DUF397)